LSFFLSTQGSNGAGKTSTVSILTGLLRPTSGDCLLYGNSIVNDPAIARRSLGICPQHNVLFDSLTVTEHLYFFLRIKGIMPNAATVRSNAQEVGLGEFLKTTSIALSGGNKRKLSVAIALSGDPSVLVLDEPTSAMDPHSRRAIWDLIREKRLNRVTFLVGG
jgi:ATP-binding cassette subfamily A (ABC1) protein 3